jgi:hypothetical protein
MMRRIHSEIYVANGKRLADSVQDRLTTDHAVLPVDVVRHCERVEILLQRRWR